MTSKFALVIANTEYQDASFAKLTAPGKDAEEFYRVLQDPELAAFDHVQVLLNEDDARTRRAIARFFADRKRDDLLLLYFSGHGIRNGQGQLFLAANDTEISILEATGIPAEFVTYLMNNSRSQRQLLILDCCNSGAFAHGTKAAYTVGKSMGIATAFEGSGYGRVVLTATDATQYAWEGDKVIGNTQNSVFTHFLIEGLKGDADLNGDGRIDVDELYSYAYEHVVQRTPQQTPGKWSYKQQGADIVLRENLKPREVMPAPLPADLLEMLSHPNSGVRKVGIEDLIGLLDGKHLGLARAAEEKLREIAINDDGSSLRKTASDELNRRGIVVGAMTNNVETKQEPDNKSLDAAPISSAKSNISGVAHDEAANQVMQQIIEERLRALERQKERKKRNQRIGKYIRTQWLWIITMSLGWLFAWAVQERLFMNLAFNDFGSYAALPVAAWATRLILCRMLGGAVGGAVTGAVLLRVVKVKSASRYILIVILLWALSWAIGGIVQTRNPIQDDLVGYRWDIGSINGAIISGLLGGIGLGVLMTLEKQLAPMWKSVLS